MRVRSLLLLVSALVAVLAALVWARVLPLPGFLDDEFGARAEEEAPEEADVLEEEGFPDLAARPREARAVANDLAPDGAVAPPAAVAAREVGFDGVVVRGDGRAARGAQVTLLGPDGVVARGVTDEEGRFHLDVARGIYDVVVRSGFDGALFLRSVVVDGRPLARPLELLAAVDVRVEVHAEGRPSGGAKVRARLQPEGRGEVVVAEGTTGEDGAFLAEAIPPGVYVLEVAMTEGYVVTRRLDVTVDRTVAFAVPAGVPLSGRVTDAATRLPLAARVLVTVGLADESSLRAEGESGSDGAYEMSVPRGRVRTFAVVNPEYAPFPSGDEMQAVLRSLRGLVDQPSVVRDAALRRGSVVRGIVTMEGTKEPVENLDLRFTQRRIPVVRTVRTSADGSYEAKGLSSGTWTADVVTPGWYPGRGTRSVRVAAAAADGTPVDAVLDVSVWSAGHVSGVVVTTGDTPAAGARVWLYGGGGIVRGAREAGRPLETIAGGDGAFSIDDVPPDVSLRVRAALGDAEAVPSAAFRLADGPPPPLRLVVGPTARLHGRVTDLHTRDGVAGARVVADPLGEPAGRGRREATADAEGRYQVASLLPGAWRVTASLRREYVPTEPRDIVVGGDARDLPLDLVLDPGLVVAGVVSDDAGRAVSGARVTLEGTEDGGAAPVAISRAANTDASGRFRMSGFRSGRYEFLARRNGFQTERLDLRGGEDRLRIVLRRSPPAPGD